MAIPPKKASFNGRKIAKGGGTHYDKQIRAKRNHAEKSGKTCWGALGAKNVVRVGKDSRRCQLIGGSYGPEVEPDTHKLRSVRQRARA